MHELTPGTVRLRGCRARPALPLGRETSSLGGARAAAATSSYSRRSRRPAARRSGRAVARPGARGQRRGRRSTWSRSSAASSRSIGSVPLRARGVARGLGFPSGASSLAAAFDGPPSLESTADTRAPATISLRGVRQTRTSAYLRRGPRRSTSLPDRSAVSPCGGRFVGPQAARASASGRWRPRSRAVLHCRGRAHDRRASRGVPALLRGARPPARPLALADPARRRPLDALHRRRHAAVQEVLPRARRAARRAASSRCRRCCAPAARTPTSPTSGAPTATARSSRCSATSRSASTSSRRRSRPPTRS